MDLSRGRGGWIIKTAGVEPRRMPKPELGGDNKAKWRNSSKKGSNVRMGKKSGTRVRRISGATRSSGSGRKKVGDGKNQGRVSRYRPSISDENNSRALGEYYIRRTIWSIIAEGKN